MASGPHSLVRAGRSAALLASCLLAASCARDVSQAGTKFIGVGLQPVSLAGSLDTIVTPANAEPMFGAAFNTAISALMVFTNHLTSLDKVPTIAARNLALIVSPFAPHLGEEWPQ